MRSQRTLPPDWNAMTNAAVLFTKSLLMGLDHATRKMEFDDGDGVDIENLPFEEAVEYLKKRNVLSADEYYSLSDKMKFRAFTVSRIADGDLLKKLNRRLAQSLEAGESLSEFKRWTRDDLLNGVGMGSTNFSYWETVFRTNVQAAYNAGRAMGFEEDKPLALEFIGIDDARTTDICRSLQNPKIILPYDDPFWASHWPPLHFNCRSTVRGIYDESELPKEFISPEPSARVPNGFGKFPLSNDNWWNELSSQARRAKEYGVQGEIDNAYSRLIGSKFDKLIDSPKSETRKELETTKVEKREIKVFDKPLTQEKIIDRLAGNDKTKGSCSSLAFAFAANKAGFNVLDFRGGKSLDIFSSPYHIKEIAKLNGVKSEIVRHINDFTAVEQLLKKAEVGKQYYLSTGRHAAIINRLEKGAEFLELQDNERKGFHPLTKERLKNRFSCKKSCSKYGIKIERSSIMIDIESLGKSKEFIELMKYINTSEDAQRKGAGGFAK